jgi:hypothetical protein
MRNFPLSLLTCAALLMACQTVTPTPMKIQSPSPNMEINDAAPILPESIVPPVSQAQPVSQAPPVSAETLSSNPIDQNNNQTEIDLAIGTINKSSGSQTNSAQTSSDITPKDVARPKTFDPTKIIGFATSVLVHNLGSANMVRKEGSIEVWQYRFGSCVVDFFFYPVDEGASRLILKTWDMRTMIMGDRLDRGSCRDEMNHYHHKLSSKS